MARRVLADFDAEILKRLANRSDLTAANRSQFLHDAYLWTCKSFLHPQIEATTTAVQAIASDLVVPVAEDIWWIEAIQNSDQGRILEPGDKDVIEDMLKSSGIPTEFYWWAEEIKTNRKPLVETNYAIWYIKIVEEITTSPVIDRLFDPIIIMKAAEIGLSTIRDFKEAAHLSNEIDDYTKRWSLPKRESKKNMTGAGVRPRFK